MAFTNKGKLKGGGTSSPVVTTNSFTVSPTGDLTSTVNGITSTAPLTDIISSDVPNNLTIGSDGKLLDIENNGFRSIQTLNTGVNTITHNLGYSIVTVDVRNDVTGETVLVRVVNETNNSCDIVVPVTLNNARITIK